MGAIPGPVFNIDNWIPCGCKISRDEDTKRLRLWYCATHAAAFDILDALRLNADALDRVITQIPPLDGRAGFQETAQRARETAQRARAVIKKATADIWRP